ncbi:amino acid permease [Paenibacillus sp. LHD-117]|uniref:APC family permease n=1 Tax=Paenibacillus sp. LHD-117 TaxID=3071412 RepID=UPI0027E029A8|nr:amino acid permease [Paenibacillus sp. LHD-117]MDQ6418056.1 amino acid permease [Paenibacillus sp. LHD-117]
MIVAIAGLLLAAAVCAFSLLVGRKAQQGLQRSRYQSMIQYGLETQLIQDKNDLHRFGLSQLLRRTSGGLSVVGMSMNTMAIIGGGALLFGPALEAGGPSVIGIGLPIVALLSICVSASLAELVSGVPTAGGIYHVAYQLGGRKWGIRAGWLHLAGYLAKLALFIGGFAFLVDSLLASRFGYDSTVLTFCAAAGAGAFTQAALCHYGQSIANKVQAAGVWLQIVIILSAIVGLVWMFWPGDYSPVTMYQWLDSNLEQPVQPLMFVLGFLLLAQLFTGMDGAAHGAEETIEPRVRVPWAIYLSTAYTYIALFVLLFFMTLIVMPAGGLMFVSPELFHASGLGGFVQYAAAGWGGSVWLKALIIVSLWQSGQQTMTACSRAVFSLARDEALPFSRKLASLSFRRHTPLIAIWSVACAALLLLIGLGSLQTEGAFMPLIAAAIVCLHLAYAIPVGLSWLSDRSASRAQHKRGTRPVEPGGNKSPWQLGEWSFPIRSAALAWLILSAGLTAGIVHPFGGITAAAVTLALTATDFRYGSRRATGKKRRERQDRSETAATAENKIRQQ